MVRATMAAFGPVERPVIAAVKGISAMIRMKKGKERSTLTTKPTIWLMVRTIGEARSEEHTSELQSRGHLVCRLLLEKKNNISCCKILLSGSRHQDRGR